MSLSAIRASDRCRTARRPEGYLDPDNAQWPDEARLDLTPPEMLLEHHTPEAIAELVGAEIHRLEAAAHKRMRDNVWRFMGAKAVLRVSPMRRATSFQPLRSLNPTFAIGRGMRDAFFAAVVRLRYFRRAYRVA